LQQASATASRRTVYFKNLNGFRFIAAFMVIICHLELFKGRSGIENSWHNRLVFEAGTAGVDFFFVLSGFLITYLLLQEIDQFGRIQLKKFYLRRILRIWPLYYLVLFVSFFAVPAASVFYIEGYSDQLYEAFLPKLFFSVLLMPNVALFLYGEIPYASPLWSVGVEEQFYLFWPLVVMLSKGRLKIIFAFIATMLLLKVAVFVAGTTAAIEATMYEKVKNLVAGTRMECMGIGAIGAVLHHRRSGILRHFVGNTRAAGAILLVPASMYMAEWLMELHHVVYSVLFLIIILNGATHNKTFVNVEGRMWFSMGTISYGLYVWHPVCIGLTLGLFQHFGWWTQPPLLSNVLYYSLSIALTCSLSYVSYYYYERFFLSYKTKAAVVISGNEAKSSQARRSRLTR
jgi:peptidoglycan/LPS O-acetylase OafA/YrhL